MRIAILGGGFTGLSASYYLAKKGHEVTIFEKEPVLGGLAVGFKSQGWDWYLERAYHHLLSSENEILDFADEIGFEGIFFKEPETASLYEISNFQFPISKQVPINKSQITNNNFRTFPVDSPQKFLQFPLLSMPEKIRAGLVIAFLKASPFLSLYEKYTAEEFLKKSMGEHAWEVLWEDLFRKKFGKYTEKILASFIWARITKRAKRLGYIEGGFQTFIDYVENRVKGKGVRVKKAFTVNSLQKRGERFVVNDLEEFDSVISTLPTIIMSKLTSSIFSQNYLEKFTKLRYLHAVVLILETKQPILKDTYWLNVCTPKIPLMLIGQHTNFIDKKHYGGNHLVYIGWYLERDNPLFKMSKEEVVEYCSPHLNKVSNFKLKIINSFLFYGPFAQPIFDRDFVKNKPDFITPVKNFYIANLDMTYPYDRGTNYAVKLGRDVAAML